MTTRTALFALLAVWGVATSGELPARAEDDIRPDATEEITPLERSFTNRVWIQVIDDALPGVTRIFLSDGSLVQDSCWESYRLSRWQMTSPSSLSWTEDGTSIAADIVSLTADSLVLSLQLAGGQVEERYRAGDVPWARLQV